MIIRINKGRSFKGAGAYLLHDKAEEGKPKPSTAERVAWTQTRKCMHDAPQAALAEMIRTAEEQLEIKAESGGNLSGRPLQKPVMTVALSWSPKQTPTDQEMARAADEFLKHMGLNEHQAVIIRHTDTAHPHVHLIINRIHPETGKANQDNYVYNRAQKWAAQYEQAHGKIYCPKRTRSAEEKRQPLHDACQAGAEQTNTRTSEGDKWPRLKSAQRAERLAFWQETSRLRKDLHGSIYRRVGEEFRPQWQTVPRNGLPDEIKSRRSAIKAAMQRRFKELSASVLEDLNEKRAPLYKALLTRQRAERADLRSGDRGGRQRSPRPRKAANDNRASREVTIRRQHDGNGNFNFGHAAERVTSRAGKQWYGKPFQRNGRDPPLSHAFPRARREVTQWRRKARDAPFTTRLARRSDGKTVYRQHRCREAGERYGRPLMARQSGRTRLPPAAREDFAGAMAAITQRARQARTSLSGLILAEFRDKFDRVSRDTSLTREARAAQIARLFEEQAARLQNMHRTLSHDMGAECTAVRMLLRSRQQERLRLRREGQNEERRKSLEGQQERTALRLSFRRSQYPPRHPQAVFG